MPLLIVNRSNLKVSTFEPVTVGDELDVTPLQIKDEVIDARR